MEDDVSKPLKYGWNYIFSLYVRSIFFLYEINQNMLKRFYSTHMYKSVEKREDELSQKERDEILSLDEILNILGWFNKMLVLQACVD